MHCLMHETFRARLLNALTHAAASAKCSLYDERVYFRPCSQQEGLLTCKFDRSYRAANPHIPLLAVAHKSLHDIDTYISTAQATFISFSSGGHNFEVSHCLWLRSVCLKGSAVRSCPSCPIQFQILTVSPLAYSGRSYLEQVGRYTQH